MPRPWKINDFGLFPGVTYRLFDSIRRFSQPPLAAIAAVAILAGGPATAQTYSLGVGGAPFGTAASAGSGSTVFTIDAGSGTVSRNSGNGGRVSTGAANAIVTIACGNQNQCNSKTVNVKVGVAGSPTGRLGAITAFNVASGSGTVSNVSGSNPVTFQLAPIGKNSSKTFRLGMTFPIAGDNGSGAAGPASTSYYVSVAAAPSTPPSSGTSGSLTATVYKSLSLSKGTDLTFGRVVRPVSGSGTVTLNSNGTRTSTGAVWLNSPFPIRSSYTATGDGGKVLSISIDPSFTMARAGGGSITVTTNNSIVGTPILGAGSSGSYTFFVGGSFPISSTTAAGAYTGTFNVTVAYN